MQILQKQTQLLQVKLPVTALKLCNGLKLRYFLPVVTNQWSNVFACKSRKMSFTTSSINSVILQGIVFVTSLLIFFLYAPGVQDVFGSRPYQFMMFCYGLPFSISLLIWDETRKYCTIHFRWFFKYAYL
ncbi:hypothetical protein ABPG72_022482 [Tetrahymena utriculariae]